MYKNIEILDKEKSKELKFDNVDTTQIAKILDLFLLDLLKFGMLVIAVLLLLAQEKMQSS